MIESVSFLREIVIDHLPLRSHTHFNLLLTDGDAPSGATINVNVLVGNRRHPCLALAAGVHGDEYDGILTLHEVAREMEPARLQGTLIIVPVVNPFAFVAAQRRTPEDGKDLNRVFPGSPRGSLSERLAHHVCYGLLRHADLVFTLHGSTAESILVPWVEFFDRPNPVGSATYEAARASGFPDLVALPILPGVLQTALAEMNVPVIEGEVGGLGETQRENVVYYKERVMAVARHAGVLPVLESSQPAAEQHFWHLCPIETQASGVFLREVSLRQAVHAGDRLGTLLDVQGAEINIVRAPQDGVIGGYRVHAGVRPGDRIFTLWTPAIPSVSQGRAPGARQ